MQTIERTGGLRPWRTIIATVLASVVLAGCAAATERGGGGSKVKTDASDLFNLISSRAGAGSSVWQPQNIVEVLPNQSYTIDGRPAEPLSPLLVVGTPVSVELEQSYRHDDFAEGGPRSVPVDDDDKRSAWRAYRVTVEPEVAVGQGQELDSFDFGITFGAGASPERIEAEILSLDRILVVTTAPGFFEFDKRLHGVLLSGAGLGIVKDDESISFPAMAEVAPAFVEGFETLDQVIQESHRDKATKSIDTFG